MHQRPGQSHCLPARPGLVRHLWGGQDFMATQTFELSEARWLADLQRAAISAARYIEARHTTTASAVEDWRKFHQAARAAHDSFQLLVAFMPPVQHARIAMSATVDRVFATLGELPGSGEPDNRLCAQHYAARLILDAGMKGDEQKARAYFDRDLFDEPSPHIGPPVFDFTDIFGKPNPQE
jgi:hypothetical protein